MFKMNEPLTSTHANTSDMTPLVDNKGRSERSHGGNGGDNGARKISEVQKNRLGTINGVFVPCLLTITGVVMFLRFGWGVGQVGFAYMLIIFAIAQCQCISTTLSVAAIVTNGNMRGGGSYYMISRTLGPEFGGSIGILFYAAYCVNSAFFSIGCGEEIIETWFESSNSWIIIGVSSLVLFVCLLIALGGARYFTKVNTLLLVIEFIGIFVALFAMLFRGTVWLKGESTKAYYDDQYYKHYEWSLSKFEENWDNLNSCSDEEWSKKCKSFQSVFAVIFPAFTGIMEGANLSGDLQNPAKSLPVGTLSAQNIALMVYFLLIFGCAGSYDPYILIEDSTVMQETAWDDWGYYLVVIGVFIASMSSSLGGLFGGSRIMQAIARDELYPYTKFLGYGSKKGDEPYFAIFLTWFIAQCLVFIGSLDGVATLATCFFCLSYACVNFTCFLLEVSGTPNFRPQFKYYSWHTALFGLICNLAVMVYVNYVFALSSIIIMIAIFIFLTFYLTSSAYRKNAGDDDDNDRRDKNIWGDVTQSILFHQVRKYLLRLDERKHHSKTWRPSVLLFVDTSDLALIDFANNLKKGGLYVIGNVISGPDFQRSIGMIKDLKRNWILFCEKNSIKAFSQFTLNNDVLNGYQNLLLLSGLGAMQPNTIVMPLLSQSHRMEGVISELFGSKNEKEEQKDENEKQKRRSKRSNQSGARKDRALSGVRARRQQLSLLGTLDEKHRGFVVDSPAMLDEMEYITLMRDILKYHRNLILTFNFEKLDCQLVVSETISQKFEASSSKLKGSPFRSRKSSKPELESNDELKEKEKLDLENASLGTADTEMVSQGQIQGGATSSQTEQVQRGKYGSFVFGGGGKPSIDCFVDVWIFADNYSFNVEIDNVDLYESEKENKDMELQYDKGFPMLMMQLAHVLLLNKKWATMAKLRVFLVMNENDIQKDSEEQYYQIIEQLRLEVDSTIVIKNEKEYNINWKTIADKVKENDDIDSVKDELYTYWKQMNEMIKEYSKNSLFTFLKLPNLPPAPKNEDDVNRKGSENDIGAIYESIDNVEELYFQLLHVLVHDLPPTAIVATGEPIPVISVDI